MLTDGATPTSYLSTTDGITVAHFPHSLSHTYFKQRQRNTRASLPQGDRPAGLGAAQTSIYFGGEASAQKFLRRWAFPIPTPPKNTYGGGLPYPTHPYHT